MTSSNAQYNLELPTPLLFNFEECLLFLARSNQEVLHTIKDNHLYKLLKINQELILCKIGVRAQQIQVEFPIHSPSRAAVEQVQTYIEEWFDLGRDLQPFYHMAQKDVVLQHPVEKYKGLRIIGIPDLFEALVWAIIGQQINLTFAYTLKKRFVEQFGESVSYDGDSYWVFPSCERIASLTIEDLRALQFTLRKSEYIIAIAREMASGALTKEQLLQIEDKAHIKKKLMSIRGVGEWTADYVLMKCFHEPTSFPIADVGLQNALKMQLALDRKPTIDEIKKLEVHWRGWQAYATFYLWRSLYDENETV
ncbi:DNA-3-methyladenine glycosylase family protein [Lysinibacillus sp. NPDC097195]|uniref:DNA-3-methyladenine glycosylase family protein n=1 Tax=Lysinibacillus sp. NPDC097195 TaxID=3364141 RepID=UPI00382FA0ED